MKRTLRRMQGRSIGEIVRLGPRYVRDVAVRRALAAYYRRTLHADPEQRAQRRRAALERLRGGGTVTFLCRGNICRGPFAERYARRQLEARDVKRIDVDSAGLKELTDPTSPPDARTIAERLGVDLSDHRAVPADAEAIDRADLILLMDYRNYHNFTNRFPDAADRMFLLGIFGDGPGVRIADPHGEGEEAFETAYEEIRTCIDNLVAAVARGRPVSEGSRVP